MAYADGKVQPAGKQQITDLSASTSLTVPAGAVWALIQAETQDVRYHVDGTAPTSGVGIILKADTAMSFVGDLSQLRFIEVTAGAKLNIIYSR